MKSRLSKLFSLLIFMFTLVLLVGCEFPFSFSPTNSNTTKNPSQSIEPRELKYGFYTIEDGVEDLSFLEGYPWINTSIEGVMAKIKRPEAKDDFYAYTNYEYLKDYKMPDGKDKYGGPIFEGDALTQAKINAILNEKGSALNRIYTLLHEGSAASLKAEIEATMALTDTEIANLFKSKEMFYATINQLEIRDEDEGLYITLSVQSGENLLISYDYASYYSDQADEFAEALNEVAIAMGLQINDSLNFIKTNLTKLGEFYEDIFNQSGEAYNGTVGEMDSVYNGFIDLKSALLDLGFSSDTNVACDRSAKMLSNAIDKEIQDNGYGLIRNMIVLSKIYYYRYFIGVENFLNLYRESLDNIDGFDEYNITDTTSVDDFVLNIIKNRYAEVLSREFSLRYANNPSRQIIANIIEEVIAEYKLLLAENDWLSETTKAKAIEKLDAMTYVAYFEDGLLNTDSFESTSTDLIGLYEDYYDYVLTYYDLVNVGVLTGMPPYETNASYFPRNNRFAITYTIVSSYIDNENIKKEYIYGSIGTVIGHEISHGFDSTGSNYDKDGNYTNWWTDEDRTAFEERIQKIIDLFDKKLFSFKDHNLIGKQVDGEVTADLGGMKVMLRLMSKLENPDYQEFFKAYATQYSYVYTYDKGYNDTLINPHPLSYLRTNLTLAQFDIFQETFNIKEDDGMYIPEKDRILVW